MFFFEWWSGWSGWRGCRTFTEFLIEPPLPGSRLSQGRKIRARSWAGEAIVVRISSQDQGLQEWRDPFGDLFDGCVMTAILLEGGTQYGRAEGRFFPSH